MYLVRSFSYIFFIMALLAGCSQQAMFDFFVPKEESALAKQILSQLEGKDYRAVEGRLDPSIGSTSVRGSLEQMAAIFPPEKPKGINTVGANTSTINGSTTYSLTYEYTYSGTWLLANIVLQKRNDRITILGLHVRPMKQSLEAVNRFTFQGKGVVNYIIFALAVLIPIFILFTLVLCFRTPVAKRKWLWLLFVALGLVQLSFNWTNGAYTIRPISFAFLGAGFFSAGPYAPVILNIAIPVGAIVFLVRRRSLIAKNAGQIVAKPDA